MEELIKPSIDECLFQLNYYQFISFITFDNNFETTKSLIDHLQSLSLVHIDSLKDKIQKDKHHNLEALKTTSLINKLHDENFIKLLTEPYQKKIKVFCEEINLPKGHDKKLEEALFNYFICLKIENFLKNQTIAKKIENDYKNAIIIRNAFESNIDNFLKTYDNEKIDSNLRMILNKNSDEFKAKIRKDIHEEFIGNTSSELEDPLDFAKDFIENTLFKTVLKPGRRPARSLNGLLLSLYHICYSSQDSTYLTKVMITLDFLKSSFNHKIEGIELSEPIVRKRIKDLLKAEKEQNKIIEQNTKYLLSIISQRPKTPIQ